MRPGSGPWGLVVGIVLGFVIGSASIATATFGYKGWQRFGGEFQLGYLAGFFDMANLARNLDPGGFVDENYPVWPNVRLREWQQTVDGLYQDPKNQEYGMYAMLRIAAAEMKKKHGPGQTTIERLAPRFRQQIDRAKKAEAAARAGSGDSKPAAPAVTGAPPKPASAAPPSPWGRKKRRCPCPDEPKDSASLQQPGDKGAAPAAEPAKAETPAQPSGGPAAPTPGQAQGVPHSKP